MRWFLEGRSGLLLLFVLKTVGNNNNVFFLFQKGGGGSMAPMAPPWLRPCMHVTLGGFLLLQSASLEYLKRILEKRRCTILAGIFSSCY